MTGSNPSDSSQRDPDIASGAITDADFAMPAPSAASAPAPADSRDDDPDEAGTEDD